MKTRRYWIAVALFLLLMVGAMAAIVLPGQGSTEQAARATVEAFCRNELGGSDPFMRERLVKFSPEVEAEFENSWMAMYVELGRQVVVSSYAIKEVRVEGKRATAVVAYQRLARTVNAHDDYVADRKDNDLVTLNLVFDQGWRSSRHRNVSLLTAVWEAVFTRDQWWVLDPPALRISKQALLEYYEEEVRRYSPIWKEELNSPKNDKEQKANIRARRDKATGNLRFLKSLP